MNLQQKIKFPEYTGIRCLMMPYIQGDPESVPDQYRNGYEDIIKNIFVKRGDIGFLTIDESVAKKGKPHRGKGSKFERAIHTEACQLMKVYNWGSGGGYSWGNTESPEKSEPEPDPQTWRGAANVTLDRDVQILLANNTDDTCAVWDFALERTTRDGDLGHKAHLYPYEEAIFMKAGEVHQIGILTPHESLPVKQDVKRQFLRILGSGVHGREPYFTENPLMEKL